MLKATKYANSINSLFFTALVFTFPEFFLFNPIGFGVTVLSGFQIFSTLSWIILVLSPMFLIKASVLTKRRFVIQVIAVSLWPLAVILIRVFLLISMGDPGLTYIASAPIFLVSDFLMPFLLVVMLNRSYKPELIKNSTSKKSVTGYPISTKY